MANKLVVSQSITWTAENGGDSIKFSGTQSLAQIGSQAIERTVTATSTTAALDLGGVTGDKYFGGKNLATKSTAATQGARDSEDATNTIYVATVSPVVPSSAPYKLAPGGSFTISTAADNWYVITGGAASIESTFAAAQF